jgi:hypothetical protein
MPRSKALLVCIGQHKHVQMIAMPWCHAVVDNPRSNALNQQHIPIMNLAPIAKGDIPSTMLVHLAKQVLTHRHAIYRRSVSDRGPRRAVIRLSCYRPIGGYRKDAKGSELCMGLHIS